MYLWVKNEREIRPRSRSNQCWQQEATKVSRHFWAKKRCASLSLFVNLFVEKKRIRSQRRIRAERSRPLHGDLLVIDMRFSPAKSSRVNWKSWFPGRDTEENIFTNSNSCVVNQLPLRDRLFLIQVDSGKAVSHWSHCAFTFSCSETLLLFPSYFSWISSPPPFSFHGG